MTKWWRDLGWLYKTVIGTVCSALILGFCSTIYNSCKARQAAELRYTADTVSNHYFIQMVKDHNDVLKGYNSIIGNMQKSIELLDANKLDKDVYYNNMMKYNKLTYRGGNNGNNGNVK